MCKSLFRERSLWWLAILVAFFHGVAEAQLSRDGIASEVGIVHKKILGSFSVTYSVDQVMKANEEASLPHVGASVGAEDYPLAWHAFRAWDDHGMRFFHYTRSGRLPDGVPGSGVPGRFVMGDGDLVYDMPPVREMGMVGVSRNIDPLTLGRSKIPQCELYKELVGIASRRSGWGITFVDMDWTGQFDPVDALLDSWYEGGYSPDGITYNLEFPGVDYLQLSVSHNYAIKQRVFYSAEKQGSVKNSYDVINFRQVSESVYVPGSVVVRCHSKESGESVIEASLTVSDASFLPDQSLFKLKTDGIVGFVDEDRLTIVRMRELNGRTIRDLIDEKKDEKSHALGWFSRNRVLAVTLMVNLIGIGVLLKLWKARTATD